MKKRILFFIIGLLALNLFAVEKLDVLPGKTFIFDYQGNMFANYGTFSIAKYSPSGERLLIMGQRGEGPGDFKRLGWFAINPADNIIYTTEFVGGNRWISKFSLEGKYLGEWKSDFDWEKYNGISYVDFDSEGNFYLQTENTLSNRYKDFTLGTVEKTILKYSPTGKLVKELYKMNTDFFCARDGKGNVTIPFHNYLSWIVYKNKLIIREHWGESLKVYTLDGSIEKEIKLPFNREKIRQKDIEEWENWMKSFPEVKKSIAEGILDLKYWRNRIPFPKYKPISGDKLYVDSHGNVFSKKYSFLNDADTTWAIINLEKASSSIINFKQGEKLIGIWKDYFFFSTKDDEDNYAVLKKNEKEIYPGA